MVSRAGDVADTPNMEKQKELEKMKRQRSRFQIKEQDKIAIKEQNKKETRNMLDIEFKVMTMKIHPGLEKTVKNST